jgi:Mor family transcriptional regulator
MDNSPQFKTDMEILLELVGADMYNAILKEFGGQALYITRKPHQPGVYDLIRAEYRAGARYRDLAHKYGFSETYIRKICRPQRHQVAA